MEENNLKQRTKKFALDVIKMVDSLPKTTIAHVIGKQLLRAGTSVGANYRSACRARSTADLIAKMGIVEEEADETLFWLEMLIECKKARVEELTPMMDEAEQLLRIFAASRMTAKASVATR